MSSETPSTLIKGNVVHYGARVGDVVQTVIGRTLCPILPFVCTSVFSESPRSSVFECYVDPRAGGRHAYRDGGRKSNDFLVAERKLRSSAPRSFARRGGLEVDL